MTPKDIETAAKIKADGHDPAALRRDEYNYKMAQTHLKMCSHHQKIVDDYESSTKPKWADYES